MMTDKSVSTSSPIFRWLQILLLPIVLLVGFLFLAYQQNQLQLTAREQQQKIALSIAHEQEQQRLLTSYMDHITDLLLHEKLATAEPLSTARLVAQTQTFAALRSLDAQRKGSLLRFLFETKLITNDAHIINFREADLRGALLKNVDLRDSDLSGADLSGADLSGANLTYANLSFVNLAQARLQKTDLRGSDMHHVTIREAIFTDANLQDATGIQSADLAQARSLVGTTLPDGTLHR